MTDQDAGPGRSGAKATDMARAHGERALKVLVAIAEDVDASPTARIAAANALLDRAYGKAAQPLDHSADAAIRKSLADFYGGETDGPDAEPGAA
jgi:hypothetical protein